MNLKHAAFALLFLALPAMAHPRDGGRREHHRSHGYECRDDRDYRDYRDYRPRRLDPPWVHGRFLPRYEREREEVVLVHPAPRYEVPRARPGIGLWIGF